MVSWGRESRDLLLFSQLDQGRTAKQALQASTLSWAFVSLNSQPSLRIANKENSATPSAEDRCMVEGRALTTPALQDAPSPFGRLAGPRWVNSEERLKSRLVTQPQQKL
jgi:hypothetical protein